MPAKKASSMKIPPGLTVQFYTGNYFDGNNTVVAGPYVGVMPDGFDKTVSSMKVFMSDTFVVKGRWVNRYSMNDKLAFSLTVGKTITNSKETETSVTNSFSLSITKGFEFEAGGAKASSSITASAEYSKTLRTMTSATLEKSRSETLNVECSNEQHIMVALW